MQFIVALLRDVFQWFLGSQNVDAFVGLLIQVSLWKLEIELILASLLANRRHCEVLSKLFLFQTFVIMQTLQPFALIWDPSFLLTWLHFLPLRSHTFRVFTCWTDTITKSPPRPMLPHFPSAEHFASVSRTCTTLPLHCVFLVLAFLRDALTSGIGADCAVIFAFLNLVNLELRLRAVRYCTAIFLHSPLGILTRKKSITCVLPGG